MAEQLGQAVLELTVDDSKLRAGLRDAKDYVAKELAAATRSNRSGGSSPIARGPSTPIGDLGRLVQAARDLNLNTNWGIALRTLGEVDADLAQIGAGKSLNLNASWTAALSQLDAIDSDLKLVSAGEQLNLNTSWSAALQELQEIDADLRLIGAGRALNLATSWGNFLQQLEEVKLDLDRARGGPSSPISGRLSNGSAIPGSPAAGQDDYAAAQAQLEEALQQQIARRTARTEEATAAQEKVIAAAKREVAAAEKNIAAKERAAKEEEKAAANSRAALSKRLQNAAGNAIIGGAFPALFGQGFGASVGGAAGGVAGGLLGGNFGFGLSLLGTALGQTLDNLSKALQDPIQNFDLLKQSALLSSKALERTVEGLIATGRTAEANAVIQKDLATSLGPQNLQAVNELAAKNDELARSWAKVSAATAAFISGPLARLAEVLNGAVGGPTGTSNRVSEQQFTKELQRIERQFGRRAASDVARFKFSNASGITPGRNEPLGQAVERQNKAALDYAKQRGFITKETAAAQQQLNAATAAQARETAVINRVLSANYRLIDAQTQGNRTAQLDARRQGAIAERDRRLQDLDRLKAAPGDSRRLEANQKAAQELYRIEQERLQLQKELLSAITDEAIKRQQIAQQIAATAARRDAALAASDAAANPGNSVLAARAGGAEAAAFLAQNRLGVEQAITRERELQAQYERESDPTKKAIAAQQLATAADATRQALTEAGAAFAERIAEARANLQSARDSLRGTLESNYRLLPGVDRANLRDAASQDILRGKESGILRGDFTTGNTQRLFEAAQFVRTVEAQRAQVAKQEELIAALNRNTDSERRIVITWRTNADGSATAEQNAALL